MTKPILHHVAHSRSFRVLWALCEMGIECEVVPYRIADGSLRDPSYLARSPAGRVPALEIDGQVLFESGAIIEYLCETRPNHGLGRPPGDTERAPYLTWLHYAETMANPIANLNLQWVFLRDPAMRSDTVLKIEAARLAKTLDPLEAAVSNQEYLLPSGFSGADLMLGFNLSAVPYFVHLDPYPAIQAYKERVAARPAYQKALSLDGPQEFYTESFYEVSRD